MLCKVCIVETLPTLDTVCQSQRLDDLGFYFTTFPGVSLHCDQIVLCYKKDICSALKQTHRGRGLETGRERDWGGFGTLAKSSTAP